MERILPEIANDKLANLLAKFARSGAPLHVSFRDLLRAPSVRDRVTHDLHPYPARLLVNIPSFFLSTNLSERSDLVLDPFCGSGTVLLEAILAGRNAHGADANPLASLLTRTKLTPVDVGALLCARRAFFNRIPAAPRREYPKVVNIEYWFHPHVRRDLLRLLETISKMRNPALRDFFTVALSACIKEVSLADPRLSVPVRLRKDQYPEGHWLQKPTAERINHLRTVRVFDSYSAKLDDNIHRARRLASWPGLGRYLGMSSDARKLTQLKPHSVALVITSPPYIGAQKYIRASSLSLTWLELCDASGLRELEDRNIGREHYPKQSYRESVATGLPRADAMLDSIRRADPLRAHIASVYLCEMREAIHELKRVVKPGGHVVLVAGESRVSSVAFPTPSFLIDLAIGAGFHLRLHLVDPIRSRALMTKRHRTAGRIDAESILVFRKDS